MKGFIYDLLGWEDQGGRFIVVGWEVWEVVLGMRSRLHTDPLKYLSAHL
ncbi:hypothetical protein [Acaryochloris marina]|uniref:Uncharacterized protein n=1 Tax=Acaryochloris marina (strain MBIC 11017) TaxID=329726 RepID=A8ZL23_ACAM1|nr:hypothetical protein [Acaryochloris marina]ABW31492.1 hypothetical protein AM1_A0374 [Acaryochloris marina MBIC11017]